MCDEEYVRKEKEGNCGCPPDKNYCGKCGYDDTVEPILRRIPCPDTFTGKKTCRGGGPCLPDCTKPCRFALEIADEPKAVEEIIVQKIEEPIEIPVVVTEEPPEVKTIGPCKEPCIDKKTKGKRPKCSPRTCPIMNKELARQQKVPPFACCCDDCMCEVCADANVPPKLLQKPATVCPAAFICDGVIKCNK